MFTVTVPHKYIQRTRQLLTFSVASQFFSCFISASDFADLWVVRALARYGSIDRLVCLVEFILCIGRTNKESLNFYASSIDVSQVKLKWSSLQISHFALRREGLRSQWISIPLEENARGSVRVWERLGIGQLSFRNFAFFLKTRITVSRILQVSVCRRLFDYTREIVFKKNQLRVIYLAGCDVQYSILLPWWLSSFTTSSSCSRIQWKRFS